MKNIVAVLVAVFISSFAVAQKYGYVNTQYILEKMPEYKTAQQTLDNLSEQFQKEIDAKYAEVQKMKEALQKEKILLPEEMKVKREEEIALREREVRELQMQKFGVNGELFVKRQDLIKPIQEKIYKAIKEIAEAQGYAFIFDKANSAFILYADPKNDKSEAVLKKLGL